MQYAVHIYISLSCLLRDQSLALTMQNYVSKSNHISHSQWQTKLGQIFLSIFIEFCSIDGKETGWLCMRQAITALITGTHSTVSADMLIIIMLEFVSTIPRWDIQKEQERENSKTNMLHIDTNSPNCQLSKMCAPKKLIVHGHRNNSYFGPPFKMLLI